MKKLTDFIKGSYSGMFYNLLVIQSAGTEAKSESTVPARAGNGSN